MRDFGDLLGVGGEMRGLGVGHFRRIHHSSVVTERRQWPVISSVTVLSTIIAVAIAVMTRVISRIVSEMRRFRDLDGVSRQMRLLSVRHFRRVDHSPVVGQRGWRAVIVPAVRLIRRVRGRSQR